MRAEEGSVMTQNLSFLFSLELANYEEIKKKEARPRIKSPEIL